MAESSDKRGSHAKSEFKPGNMIYPVPAVIVSVGDSQSRINLLTVAWTGTICSDPPMAYISVRPTRYSYEMIRRSGEFVINLTSESLTRAADFCGVRSGRDLDKWAACGLTPAPAKSLDFAPIVAESPVNIECRVEKIEELGSHHMFIARVTAVQVDSAYIDSKGRFDLSRAGLIAYSHGEYMSLGRKLGSFGYSVRKSKSR